MYLLFIFLITLYGQYYLSSNSYGSAEGNRIRMNYRVRKDVIDNASESKDFREKENQKKYVDTEENGVTNQQIAGDFEKKQLHQVVKREMYNGSENGDQNNEESESESDFSLKENRSSFVINKTNGLFENLDDVIMTTGEHSQYYKVHRNPENTVKRGNDYSNSRLAQHNLKAAGILATASLEPGENHVISNEEGSTKTSGYRTTEDDIDASEIIEYKDLMFHSQHRRDEDASERIVNGHLINITEMPSYVIVNRINEEGKLLLCGGNLISLKQVLSAAHCVLDYLRGRNGNIYFQISKPSKIFIRVGSNYSYKGGEIVTAKHICVHPDHSYNKDLGTYRDLSVITLKNEVELSKTVQIAKIHPLLDQNYLDNIKGKKCLIAGWGNTEAGMNAEGKPSYEMRQTTVSLLSPTSCDHYYRSSYKVEDSLCALDKTTDACQGDSGGGMFCEGMLLGVISWGLGCAAGHPGVYARADNVGDFIRHAIKSSGITNRPQIFQMTLFLIICIYI